MKFKPLSSCEMEVAAIVAVVKDGVFTTNILLDMHAEITKVLKVLTDSQSGRDVVCNAGATKHTVHFERWLYYARDMYLRRKLMIELVATVKMRRRHPKQTVGGDESPSTRDGACRHLTILEKIMLACLLKNVPLFIFDSLVRTARGESHLSVPDTRMLRSSKGCRSGRKRDNTALAHDILWIHKTRQSMTSGRHNYNVVTPLTRCAHTDICMHVHS